MGQRDWQIFFTSLFVTLLCVALITVFLMVDVADGRYREESAAPALGVEQQDSIHYQVGFMGRWYPLTLAPFNQVETMRQKYVCLVMPTSLRTLEQLKNFGIYGAKSLYDAYREWEYQKNTEAYKQRIPG